MNTKIRGWTVEFLEWAAVPIVAILISTARLIGTLWDLVGRWNEKRLTKKISEFHL